MNKKKKKEILPIMMYKLFCSECTKEMGIVDSIPIINWFDGKIQNKKQKYLYEIFKDREEGITYFKAKMFCSEKCKDKYLKEFYNK